MEALRAAPYSHKMAWVAACTVLEAGWLMATQQRLTARSARVAAVAPVLALNALLPYLFRRDTEAVTIAFAAFLLTW